jgi:hypothetical protein
MEGPAGWHSEFGRAGFASTGARAMPRPTPRNPLNDGEKPEAPAPTALATEAPPEQGDPTDAWDRPYGDASWGGQATRRTTPEQDRKPAGKKRNPPRA